MCWYFLSVFDEVCITWRAFSSYLEIVNENKSLKFSKFSDATEIILNVADILHMSHCTVIFRWSN